MCFGLQRVKEDNEREGETMARAKRGFKSRTCLFGRTAPKRAGSMLATALGVAASFLLLAGPASALMPPEPAKAGIVFSNGGRIVSMKADGSERTVLTNRSRTPRNGPYGHTDPQVSPDGTMLLFTDNRREKEWGPTAWVPRRDVVVANADGTGQGRILKSKGRFTYTTAAWMPDGSILAPYLEASGKRVKSGLLKIQPDGSGRQKVFQLKPRTKAPWFEGWAMNDLSVSPDGSKAMVRIPTEGDGGVFGLKYPDRLVVVDLATGKRRLITKEGFSGSWSPDGNSIVYTQALADSDDESCSWQYWCVRASRIMVADADGRSPRRLISGKDDQREPSWSADGTRILFQSNRNLRGSTETFEIYSVNPDGRCLTWLTNGTPASVTPSWIPGGDVTDEPGGCDPLALPLLAEVKLPVAKPGATTPFWAGESLGSAVYSGGFSGRFGLQADYMDCDQFEPKNCRDSFVLWSVDICFTSGSLTQIFGGDRMLRSQRGAPVFRNKEEMGTFTVVFTGRSYVTIIGGSKWARKEIDALRRVGKSRAVGALPKPLFPAKDVRRMKKIARVVKRSGSVRAAAKRLDRKPAAIRANLRMSRKLGRMARYGTVNCPKVRRGKSESGGSSDRGRALAGVASEVLR